MYSFRCDSVGFTIYVGDKKVKFESDFMDIPRGVFYTPSEDLAEGIRRHKYFLKGTIVETTPKNENVNLGDGAIGRQGEDNVTETTSEAAAVYEDVTRTQEAIKILKEKHGVTASMRTRADMLAAAEAVNVKFPNIK